MSNKPIHDLWEAYIKEIPEALPKPSDRVRYEHRLITNRALRMLSDLMLDDLDELWKNPTMPRVDQYARFGKFLGDVTVEIKEIIEESNTMVKL